MIYYDPRVDPRPEPLTHNPFNALVAPRPIGWIGTCDADGVQNLAPYSYFNAVSADPPIVVFAPNEKAPGGNEKDTLANVRAVPEFSVSIVSEALALKMNATSADVAPDVDEYTLAGLTGAPGLGIKPAHVAEARAILECEVLEIVPLPATDGGRRSHVVIGAVVGINLDEGLIVDGRIDSVALGQVSRLGYFDYSVVREVFEIPRP